MRKGLSPTTGAGLFVLLVILDQAIKAFSPLQLPNRGVAFGLFPGSGLLLALAGPVLMTGLTWHWRGKVRLRLPLAIIWAGIVSNLLDRMTRGAVIDVFYLGPLSVNLADLLLVGGTTLIFMTTMRTYSPK